MAELPQQPSEGALVVAAAIFYAAMSAIALVIIAVLGVDLVPLVFGDGAATARDALLGAAAGLAVVGLTVATRDLAPMKRVTDELSSIMGRPDSAAIALLAVTSAVGEELLFRGALQSWLGLWPTALLFGLLHGGTNRRLRAWAIFATLAGILLGWLAEFTGNLLAPILCHLTVNFWNLHLLAAGRQDSDPT